MQSGGAAGTHGDEAARLGAAERPHVTSVRAYAAVFVGLVTLTGLTVGISALNLGPISIYAAMLIAMIKAGLVIAFFMHLGFARRFQQLVFVSAIIVMGIFFTLTFTDLAARSAVLQDQGTFTYRERQREVRAEERLQKAIQEQQATRPRSDAGSP